MAPQTSYEPPRLSSLQTRRVAKRVPDVRMLKEEAVQVLNKAVERFLHDLASQALAKATEDQRKQLQYTDIAEVVAESDRLAFLEDYIPMQVRYGSIASKT